jgi:5'-nucleotidase / UDP-sugar diphosphatase
MQGCQYGTSKGGAMNSLLRRTALLAVAAAITLALPTVIVAQTPTAITIIHVNDTHSHLDAFGPRDANLQGSLGGIARAATVIATMKQTAQNPLFVHGGDAFHGDVFFNAQFDVPELLILKQLGVDAMAVGNHEFDLTPAALVGALSHVGAFPLTSANLDFSACTGAEICALLPNWVRPGFIKDFGAVKVGIFGLTTPSDPLMQPQPVVVRPDVTQTPPAEVVVDLAQIAQAEVNALRAQGAQVVVLLSHLGRPTDSQVLPLVSGIDVVIGAHDHLVDKTPFWFDTPTGKVPGVSAGSHYLYVGRLRLTYTPGQGVKVDDWALVPVDSNVPAYPPIADAVKSAKQAIVEGCGEDFWSPAIGYAPFPISRDYNPRSQRRDTAMGNLVTDSLRHFTNTDLALSVKGLIGEGLDRGPIVADDVYRPITYGYTPGTCYGFRVATFEITGAQLLKALETCLILGPATKSDTYDVEASGLRFKYDSSRPAFQKVLVGSVHVNGHRFDPAATYTVTTNEGIPALLPHLPFGGVQVSNVQVIDGAWEYTVLRDYVRMLGIVDYTSQARIRDVAALPSRRQIDR